MVRKHFFGIMITATLAVCLAAMLLCSLIFDSSNTYGKVGYAAGDVLTPQLNETFSAADDEYLEQIPCLLNQGAGYYTLSKSAGQWKTASPFSSKGLYFGLPVQPNVTYSAEGAISTPKLMLADNDYRLFFDYYTTCTAEMANVITVFAGSEDGFIKLKTADVSYVSATMQKFSVDLPRQTEYIKIVFKVYADGDNTDTGIFLDNIGIAAKAEYDLTGADFTIELAENQTIIYDGGEKKPLYTVTCSNNNAQYFVKDWVQMALPIKQDDATTAINAGNYYLCVTVFTISNEIYETKALAFTVGKAELNFDLTKLQTIAYTNHLAIYNTPVFLGERELLPTEIGNVSYLTSVDGGADVAVSGNIISTPTSGEFGLKIAVEESDNFKAAVSDKTVVGGTRINGDILTINNYIDQQTYSGTKKTATYGFVLATDINTSTTYSGDDFSIKYYAQGEDTATETTINAGLYRVEYTYFEQKINTYLKINPTTITGASYIGAPLDKIYDGSDTLYYTRKETPESTDTITSAAQTLVGHDFILIGAVEDDKVSLAVEKARYSYTYGKVKVLIDGLSLVGDDAANYNLGSMFLCDLQIKEYTISKAKLALASDENGSVIIKIADKIYDGTATAEIDYDYLEETYGAVEDAPVKFYGLAGTDSVNLNKLSAVFVQKYADECAVELSLTDSRMFDRYSTVIETNKYATPLTGKILPKTISVDKVNSNISVADKLYSGDNTAEITFSALVFNDILADDATVMTGFNTNFIIKYSSAEFAQINVGNDINVAVSGIELSVLKAEYTDIVNSYAVEDIALTGKITAETLTVKSEILRASVDGYLPELVIYPSEIPISQYYYNTQSDAQNNTNALGLPPSAEGTYFIRVASANPNYTIEGGFSVVKLIIGAIKTPQNLVFEGFDEYFVEADKIAMLKDGILKVNAVSYAESGERTNLNITYSLSVNGDRFMTQNGNEFTATTVGTVSIIATQAGDIHFSAASAAITVNIYNETIVTAGLTFDTNVYVGDIAPSVNGTVSIAGNVKNVTVNRANDNLITNTTNTLAYQLLFENTYAGIYPISLAVSPIKPTLEIAFPNTIVGKYGQKIDFLSNVELTVIKNASRYPAEIVNYAAFGIVFALDTIETDILPESYTVSLTELGACDYLLTATTDLDYTIVLTSESESIILVIEKAVLTVKVNPITKFYGETLVMPAVNSAVTVSGGCKDTDLTAVLDTISIYAHADTYSSVGSYILSIAQSDVSALPINDKYIFNLEDSFIQVKKTPLMITVPNAGSVYGAELSHWSVNVGGLFIASDKERLAKYVKTTLVGATKDSDVGTFTILVEFFGADDNYDITVSNGVYTISEADFSGINFENKTFLYDGKKHSIAISYDNTIWTGLTVAYNITEVSETGVYTVTATVSKPNYKTTVYTAQLTISTLSISSSSANNKVIVIDESEGSTGFSPDLTLTLVSSTIADITATVTAKLNSSATTQENILGIYDLVMTRNSEPVTTTNGKYKVTLSLLGINSANNIRILAIKDGELTEIAYKFENGEFVFETENLSGIAVLKTTAITESRTAEIIIACLFGVIVIAMLSVIFGGFKGNGKARARSRRKHHKWA